VHGSGSHQKREGERSVPSSNFKRDTKWKKSANQSKESDQRGVERKGLDVESSIRVSSFSLTQGEGETKWVIYSNLLVGPKNGDLRSSPSKTTIKLPYIGREPGTER